MKSKGINKRVPEGYAQVIGAKEDRVLYT